MNQVVATMLKKSEAVELFEELVELGLSPKLDPDNEFSVTWAEFEDNQKEFQDLLDYVLGFNPVSVEQIFCYIEGVRVIAGGYLWQDGALYHYEVSADEAEKLVGKPQPLETIKSMIDKVDHALDDRLRAYSE